MHAFLSPYDSNLFGAAKRAWRQMDLDWEDNVRSSLALLALIDRGSGRADVLFTRNLQVGMHRPSMVGVCGVIAEGASDQSRFHKRSLRKYHIFMGQDARGHRPSTPKGLDDGLDGEAWLR